MRRGGSAHAGSKGWPRRQRVVGCDNHTCSAVIALQLRHSLSSHDICVGKGFHTEFGVNVEFGENGYKEVSKSSLRYTEAGIIKAVSS